jgi:hypothetical protein
MKFHDRGLVNLESPIDQTIFEVAVSFRHCILAHMTYLTDLADPVELIIKALVDWM